MPGFSLGLKNEILSAQPPEHDPNDAPFLLAPHQRTFLSCACSIPLEFIDHCWLAIREMVWNEKVDEVGRDLDAWNTGRDFELCKPCIVLSPHPPLNLSSI